MGLKCKKTDDKTYAQNASDSGMSSKSSDKKKKIDPSRW